jgi:outer membrane receptor protein involved in Fe transport
MRLSSAVVLDLRAGYSFTGHLEVFANAENLTNTRIETSRGPSGLIYVGAPCIVLGGVRVSW